MKPLVSNIRFIVQPLSKGGRALLEESEKFQEKLLRLSESTFSTYAHDLPSSLRTLQEHVIRDCVVGPHHLAFLLGDGRVCRISYTATTKSAASQKLSDDKDKNYPSKSGSRSSKVMRTYSSHAPWNNMDFLGVTGSGSWSRWGNRIGVIRSSATSGGTSTTSSSSSARKTTRGSSNGNAGDSLSGTGIRLIRAGQVRGRNLPLLSGGQRVMVPASHVPEELINQVQGVLQGKSRSVIVRELQRTNLDVNLAVNNLLSRDDEDNDDMDDGASDYIPGEELMSLLDGSMPPGGHPSVVIDADAMLPEDFLGYTFTSRALSSSQRSASIANERDDADDSLSRFNNSPWSESTKSADGKNQTKSNLSKDSGLILGGELQWWMDAVGEPIKFKLIGAMYSELTAVDMSGDLRQWKWSSLEPCRGIHPRSSFLKLDKTKVSLLATCSIQASVVTEDGAIATWMDESVASHTVSLDLPCFISDPIKNERVKSIHVCSLYSVVLTELGRIYWWGVLPFSQRKKILEKSQNSHHQNTDKDSTVAAKQELTVGSQVCLRSFPIYHSGAIAINASCGAPKVGCLLQSVWNLEKKARFYILREENQKKVKDSLNKNEEVTMEAFCEKQGSYSEATNLKKWNTVSDNSKSGSLTESAKPRKRKRSDDDDGKTEEEEESSVEEWDLKEVVFTEDVRSVPVGHVTKVDENIVAVYFTNDDQDKGLDFKDSSTIPHSCRLLHKDDVVVIKSHPPKVLDCVQKTPRRLQCDQHLQIHCINPMENNIAAVVSRTGGKLAYVNISLNSGKITHHKTFPTKPAAFFDEQEQHPGPSNRKSGCKLLNCGQGSPILLQDYNSMMYPLLRDGNVGIRDPIWADVPPLFASGMGFFSDSSDIRNTVAVLAFRSQVLMPLVMRRDIKGFQSLLNSVENNQDALWTKIFFQSLCDERCDGQRNILHMCIEMTIPTTNKEQKEDEKEEKNKSNSSKPNKPPNKPPPPRPKNPEPFNAEPTLSPPPPGGSIAPLFLSEGDRMDAVNAIANAISSVKGFPRSPEQTSPIRSAAGSSSEQLSSSYNELDMSSGRLPSATFGSIEHDTWPPELPAHWKSIASDRSEDEEGINLSMSGSNVGPKKKRSRPSTQGSWTEVGTDEKERGTRSDALAILRLLWRSTCIQPYMKKLLSHKDASGYTPFMFAIAHRAYPAALVIFKAAFTIAAEASEKGKDAKEYSNDTNFEVELEDQRELLPMLYPLGSHPDDNPLYMLCCNDACSFTWTGADHINQDIFECLTCGLTESLCCCTECARVCHKGHECKLKRTSPTAYCDCWKKCACKSLVEGDNNDRMAILRMLLHITNLYEKYNSSGQHIIHFLIQTVARQCEEQRQYRPPPRSARMSVSTFRSRVSRIAAKSQGGDQDVPEHDLRPPQFCRNALLQLLGDRQALRSLLLSGCQNRRDNLCMSSKLDVKEGISSFADLLPEDEHIMSQQSGTVRLDDFTHTIIAKCTTTEYLDRLLETLIHAVQGNKKSDDDDGAMMARRFLRSVIRVFVVLTAQSTPDKLAARMSLYNQPALSKCKKAFSALISLSVEELCEAAESLIAPVRMGVAKPTVAYSLPSTNADVIHGSTAVFGRLPFPPRTNYSDDEDDPDNNRSTKPPIKSRKRSKRPSRSRRFGGGRSRRGEETEVGSQDVANDDESDHPTASQDTQPVDDEPIAGLSRLFQDVGNHGDGDEARNDDNEIEEESDMDLTDLELNADSDSESVDTDFSEQPTLFGENLSRDHDSQNDDEDDDDDHKIMKHDEEDTDSDNWHDEVNLERRSTREQRTQARQAPHTMQWAMGTSSMVPVKPPGGSSRATSSAIGSSNSGVIYVNSRSLRRNESSLENAYINSILDRHHGGKRPRQFAHDESSINSSSVTKAQLSRLFATCVREIAHLVSTLQKGDYLTGATLNTVLEISFKEASNLRNFVTKFMEKTWTWLLTVVEATECQLRYGQVLSMASNTSHSEHPHYKHGDSRRSQETSQRHSNLNTSEDMVARQDFLSYVLSLMRSHSNEHSDLLPIVDISALKHIAYVLDTYIYYLRALSDKDSDDKLDLNARSQTISLDIGYDNSENEDDDEDYMGYHDDLYSVALHSDPPKSGAQSLSDDDLSVFAQSQASFFRRSESMTFLGCSDPHTFELPLPVALPLAEKPHILQPTSRKEELFGRSRVSGTNTLVHATSMSVSRRVTPISVNEKEDLKQKKTDGKSDDKDAQKNEEISVSKLDDLSSSVPTPPEDLSKQASDSNNYLQPDVSLDVSASMDVTQRSSAEHSNNVMQPVVSQPRVSTEIEAQPLDDSTEPHTSSNVVSFEEQAPHMEVEPVDLAKHEDKPTDLSTSAMEMPPPAATVTVSDDVTVDEEVPCCSKSLEEGNIENEISSAHGVLGRCRLTLELFSRIFLDNVGVEPKSILYELGGFEVRETKFRKEMERLRTSQTIDLQLNIERTRDALIQQTFKQLNQHAKRRGSSGQPMAVLRVKVLFDNEPGEGTGVARSFYTAICDALLSTERLPSLEGVLPGSTSSSSRKSSSSMHLSLVARLYKREREREERASRGSGSSRSGASSSGGGSNANRKISLRSFLTARYRELATGGRRGGSTSSMTAMSISAAPYVKRSFSSSSTSSGQNNQLSLTRNKQAIEDRLFAKVSSIHPLWAAKIAGMLLELPAYELLLLLRSDRSLHDRVNEAVHQLLTSGYAYSEGNDSARGDAGASSEPQDSAENIAGSSTSGESRDEQTKKSEDASLKEKDEEDVGMCEDSDRGPPMFYQPGKRGIYAVASWGDCSELRLNAYRNVGRIIGLCLLQNELCPLPLCRHVLKIILGRKVHWHDLAFFDPALYESLRQLVADAESDNGEVLEALELSFVVDLQNEEGGSQVELIPDGASVPVTKENILDYVRRYALQRMIGCCRKQLEKMRQGVYDVLPRSSVQGLTAEDLRLLVNGCGHVDVHTLISYTLFNDESGRTGSSAEKLTQFKRWFWSVVDRLSVQEKQELLYFWTGSPALPASEDGFQPMPTITIRPPDDQHLPTANTCISRLYVPLYSTKQILKQKLAIAMKTKNFGFV